MNKLQQLIELEAMERVWTEHDHRKYRSLCSELVPKLLELYVSASEAEGINLEESDRFLCALAALEALEHD